MSCRRTFPEGRDEPPGAGGRGGDAAVLSRSHGVGFESAGGCSGRAWRRSAGSVGGLSETFASVLLLDRKSEQDD
jgi:hypothetical protein